MTIIVGLTDCIVLNNEYVACKEEEEIYVFVIYFFGVSEQLFLLAGCIGLLLYNEHEKNLT